MSMHELHTRLLKLELKSVEPPPPNLPVPIRCDLQAKQGLLASSRVGRGSGGLTRGVGSTTMDRLINVRTVEMVAVQTKRLRFILRGLGVLAPSASVSVSDSACVIDTRRTRTRYPFVTVAKQAVLRLEERVRCSDLQACACAWESDRTRTTRTKEGPKFETQICSLRATIAISRLPPRVSLCEGWEV